MSESWDATQTLEDDGSDWWADWRRDATAALDHLASDPARVLRWLEGLPCQTCGGEGYKATSTEPLGRCPACGGSGILGRDGVLRLLGMTGRTA